jgi:hypothetical protein
MYLNSAWASLETLISLIIEGLITQESRPGRISAGRLGRIFALDCSDWSNGLRHGGFIALQHIHQSSFS